MFGQMLHGVGGATLYCIGIVFVDSNIKTKNSPFYQGKSVPQGWRKKLRLVSRADALNTKRLLLPCLSCTFLTLLDYVSRAHEIEIRPSVRRPSMASIISEVTTWIAFTFQLWLPLGHMPRLFFFCHF